jgi:hypothetical protein
MQSVQHSFLRQVVCLRSPSVPPDGISVRRIALWHPSRLFPERVPRRGGYCHNLKRKCERSCSHPRARPDPSRCQTGQRARRRLRRRLDARRQMAPEMSHSQAGRDERAAVRVLDSLPSNARSRASTRQKKQAFGFLHYSSLKKVMNAKLWLNDLQISLIVSVP